MVSAVGALLDSGSTLSFIPTTAISVIYEILGAVVSTTSPTLVWANCDLLTSASSLTVNFHFGPDSTSPVVKVPLNEILFTIPDFTPIQSPPSSFPDLPFADTCVLGLLDASLTSGSTILGDTFLRSAYVVYDLQNAQIGIANTNFNSTTSNIVEITSGALPAVTGYTSISTVTGAQPTTFTSTTMSTSSGLPTLTTGGLAPVNSSPSNGAAVASIPRLETGTLLVFVFSCFMACIGAGWFWA
jgi:hypothetical protein